jgi:NAD(P)-dependent dehydrogenase (short-subunit alcohol dehydrogenase family)
MTDFQGKRYWLVGASEGLGLALAKRLARAGAQVILSARSADRLAEAVAEVGPQATALPCDVADSASVQAAAGSLGDLDGVVFLAGVYWPTKAQEWDAKAVETMIDVNLTGCARVMAAVVPGMVARDRGHVVITGSLSGFRGLPGALAAIAGMLLLPFSLLMLVGFVYFQFHALPAVDRVLTGVVAAAAGMALSMGFKILDEYWKDPLALLLAALTFIGLQFLHLQLIPVVLVGGPIAMALYWPRQAKPKP